MPPRRWAAGGFALALCAALAGCSKHTTAPPSEALNTDRPNANGQIRNQSTFGASDNHSSIWDLEPGDDGNYAFRGTIDGHGGAGSLTGNGTLRWFHSVSYDPRDVRTLPATSVVPNGVVVFGRHRTDADPKRLVGDVTLYSSAGNLLDQILLPSDSSEVSISSAVPVSDSSLIAVGGERVAGSIWPLLVQISVRAGGKLARGGQAVLRGVAEGALVDVAALPPAGGEIRLFATNYVSGLYRVLGLRVTQETIAPATLDWSRDVVATLGTRLVLEGMAATATEIYVGGYTDDNRKAPSTSGVLWDSALMVSYSTAGDLRWRTVLGLTTHAELFNHVLVGPGAVYGIGEAAEYIRDNTDIFGYGLVSKLDPATGAPVASLTVGSDRYEGGFNVAVLSGANLVAGGWTEQDLKDGPFRAWVVDLAPVQGGARGVPPLPRRGEDHGVGDRAGDRRPYPRALGAARGGGGAGP